MDQEIKPQILQRYASIIASITQNAIRNTEGINQEEGLVRLKLEMNSFKDRNIHVFIDGDDVTVDIFVTADMSISIPEMVCQLQEKIKHEVENATKYHVKKINVHVVNITNTVGF